MLPGETTLSEGYGWFVSVEPGWSVHIGYPYPYGTEDDETWLAALVRRHGGKLSNGVMESAPQQRFANFPTTTVPSDFVDELTSSGRWRASVRPDGVSSAQFSNPPH